MNQVHPNFHSRSSTNSSILNPNPQGPQAFLVTYQCSVCTQHYQLEVQSNLWYKFLKHVCPHCQMVQIPLVDVNFLQNALDLDPNTRPLYSSTPTHEIAEVEFDAMDEQFFLLDLHTEEVLFLITRKVSIVQRSKHSTPQIISRLIELADKISMKSFALVIHSQRCHDELHNHQNQNPNSQSPSLSSTSTSSCSHVPYYRNQTTSSFYTQNHTGIFRSHPSERQERLCAYCRYLLLHVQQCKDPHCPIDYCSVFKDILEYRALFSKLHGQ